MKNIFTPSDRPGWLELNNKHRTVAQYCYDHFDFYPYCHPVTLPDGGELTLDLPADHPWHSGMTFAWKYLNGCNVWDFEASGPKAGSVVHRDLRLSDHEPELTQTLVWRDDQERDLLEDRRTLRVSANEQGLPMFDWHFHFTALAEEVVCERHVGWGGYGGFYIRFARGTDPVILNAEGKTNIEEEDRFRSRWCAFAFARDGFPSRTNYEHKAGMAIFDHPDNPRHPTPWLTFNRMNCQKLMPAFLRDEPLTLRRGDTLDLRYRAVSFLGNPDHSSLETARQAWAQSPEPRSSGN